MNGTRWFVTDAEEGLGRAWAEAALEGGGTVVATARDVTALDALVEIHGDAVLPLELDVADRDAVAAAVTVAESRFGGIDIAVSDPVADTEATVDEVMRERGTAQVIHSFGGQAGRTEQAAEAIFEIVGAEDRLVAA